MPLVITLKKLAFGLIALGLASCNTNKTETPTTQAETFADVKIVGAMKNVMWKGELGSRINLDTISNKTGLYGLGPESYLTGELLIKNGVCFVSKVTSDSTMTVEKRCDVSAPFFVYANVTEWTEVELPKTVASIQDLETFIDAKTAEYKRPFAFTLSGRVNHAVIHIQNLPEGTTVSSPDEAHQGQINYTLKNEEVDIVGFFSTEHKAVFTHHDSFLHMHIITKDEHKMGHLDEAAFGEMKLYLPKK